MTQEDKDLLLKDLCGRLPYGVKCKYYDCCEGDYDEGTICGFERQEFIQIGGKCIHVEEVKPYLYPLSSMTEEQRKELEDLGWSFDNFEINNINECLGTYREYVSHSDCFTLINWCYKNHFDVNNLIPMGLAKDATGLNIY